ncbi:hypothetical protein [Paracoccus pacificus]|uniref:N-acetylglucosamine-6-phosphate deacetylase n=1 Tax=Paracoccus pacificus TaxID=1463598 RepID=A0ABW4R4U1_9RHOB
MTERLTAGLCDLQVNGFAGVDFNDAALTPAAFDHALQALLDTGVTTFLPTLITATPADLAARLQALDTAVRHSRLGPAMVPGYHIEGPFLNPTDGYAGCHPAAAMTAPDAALYENLRPGLFRPILLVTLAPERPGAIAVIRSLTDRGCAVGIGHSAADYAAVDAAVAAGATLSTHLGNGLPALLPKLDNTLLAQLAAPGLSACLIADGHHVPPAALAALVRLKGAARVILVTDAVVAAAAPPGSYRFAGMEVQHTDAGAVVQPGRVSLAGSALCLDQAVRNVVEWGIAPFAQAVAWASDAPHAALARAFAMAGLTVDAGTVVWDDQMRPVRVTPGRVVAAR